MTTLDWEDLPGGITRIDTGYCRPRLAACYLLVEGGKAAFVDTGTYHSVPTLLEVLDAKGIDRDNVLFVMPTHVHLDHAGGAGELVRRLPNAQLVIHPRGARHMIDPSKLALGATSVYGEAEFSRAFGQLVPVPEQRVMIAEDGFSLNFNGRELLFLDTQGHARHHYCVFDPATRGFFTGDTFGISYREFDSPAGNFIFATTTPVQFEPQAWHRSIDRLLSYDPERMYLTHFGMVSNVNALARELRRSIDTFCTIAREADGTQDRYRRIVDGLTEALLSDLKAMRCPLSVPKCKELLTLDIELNAQGLEVWLDRDR